MTDFFNSKDSIPPQKKIQSPKKKRLKKFNPHPSLFQHLLIFKNTAWFHIKTCVGKSIFHPFIEVWADLLEKE